MDFTWIAVAAVATFVVGTGGAALCLLWLPADYFESTKVVSRTTPCLNPFWAWVWFVGRNLLGAALIFAGVVMLVIPGPVMMKHTPGLPLVRA